MTEKEAQTLICNNNTLLSQLLKLDKSQSVNNVPSFLKKISEATKSQCKKWVNTAEYKAQDIISLNGIVYIAKTDNINKNPEIFKTDWIRIILPYANNLGKIKSYLVFKVNLDNTVSIIKSYNIEYTTYITGNGYLKFKINNDTVRELCFYGFTQTNSTGRNSIVVSSDPSFNKEFSVYLRNSSGTQMNMATYEALITIVAYDTNTTIV